MLQGVTGSGEFRGQEANIQLGNQETDFYKGRVNIAICSFGCMAEHELRAEDAENGGMEASLRCIVCLDVGDREWVKLNITSFKPE